MLDNIYKKVDKHDIISFDIFDTLIIRNVAKPSDMFALVQHRFNRLHANTLIRDFKTRRMEAEKNARKASDKEIRIDDIYNEINYSELVKRELVEIERNVEYEYAGQNKKAFEIFDYALKHKKRIIICSDMYLSKEDVGKILEKCGICGYEYLFVSSDSGYRKKDGTLYSYICRQLKCKPSEILHIGDNVKSDFCSAIACGLDASLIREEKNSHIQKSGFDINKLSNSVAVGIMKNISYGKNANEKIGIQILGPLLAGFCQWLHSNAVHKKKYFFSRDGYLIKRAYEILYPKEKDLCHYLYISRKALRMPNIYHDIPYSSLVEQFPNLKRYDIKVFCDLLCLDAETREKYCERFNWVGPVYSREDLIASQEFQKLFYVIKHEEENTFKLQYELFAKYLQQEGVDNDSVFVDVGWRASAQINICDMMRLDDASGFYFGVEESLISTGRDTKKINGYLWSWDTDAPIKRTILNGRKAIFEIMFLSSQGTTVKYQLNQQKVVPVLEKNDLKQKCIENIQFGALLFVKEYKRYAPDLTDDLEAVDVMLPINDFMLYPEKKELEIGDAICENHRVVFLANPKSWSFYLLHAGDLCSDFKNSEWKVGFLSRLLGAGRGIQLVLNFFYETVRR